MHSARSVFSPNTPEMVEAHYAVPALNAVLNTLNTRLDAALIAWQLNHCECQVLITDREYSGMVKKALAELGREINGGRISPVDLAEAHLDAIAAHPHRDRIFARTTPARARAEAMAAHGRARAGQRRSLIDGVPISWKDNVDTAGVATGYRLVNPDLVQDPVVFVSLDDDEVAMIMGHEMAHALREHARERLAKTQATSTVLSIGSALLGLGQLGSLAADMGGQLLTLKFSRDDETEADLVGMEIAARAGYDPRAGVTLWQKMSAANKGAPPQWLSTHPSGNTRIEEIQANLPKVMPLYERSK